MTSTDIPALLRRGAVAVAAGRVALGLTALAWPSEPARPWVRAARMTWPRECSGAPWEAVTSPWGWARWPPCSARPASPDPPPPGCRGRPSDALDVAASLASWRELPRMTRWLVAGSAAGAALTGAAAALTSATLRASSASS